MSKKIVVITGSPRKDGNSFAMTNAFIQAVEEKGHTVTRCAECERYRKDGWMQAGSRTGR